MIRDALAAGKSFDVDKMQVSSWWMERFAINPFSLLDPVTNERLGKWVLAEEIARHGLSWKAVDKSILQTRSAVDSAHGRFITMQAKVSPQSRRLPVPTRKLILRTYLTPEEHAQIRASASKAGLSISTFCKRVCLGFSVPSQEHQEAKIELRQLKDDLSRLGVLVEQALASSTDRLSVFF